MKKIGHWLLIAIVLVSAVGQGCSEPLTSKSEPATQPSTPVTHLSPEQREESPSNVSYTVVDEEIYDKPIKTQIEQHILVSGIPTAAQLDAELLRRYQAAFERTGFIYHNPATNIYIYIYGSEEQARARQGLWIGMISKGPLDQGEPRPVINSDRLSALSSVPKERFGLSENERKAAYQEIAAAERRGTTEAMAQVPDSAIMKQIERERELQAKYKRAVARKYGVTDSQLMEIGLEGVKKGWPG
jgi:hypothetical protein